MTRSFPWEEKRERSVAFSSPMTTKGLCGDRSTVRLLKEECENKKINLWPQSN